MQVGPSKPLWPQNAQSLSVGTLRIHFNLHTTHICFPSPTPTLLWSPFLFQANPPAPGTIGPSLVISLLAFPSLELGFPPSPRWSNRPSFSRVLSPHIVPCFHSSPPPASGNFHTNSSLDQVAKSRYARPSQPSMPTATHSSAVMIWNLLLVPSPLFVIPSNILTLALPLLAASVSHWPQYHSRVQHLAVNLPHTTW